MEKLLEVKNIKKYFTLKRGLIKKRVEVVKAVDNVSFDILKGETLGLVGESGCGKTTMGRLILRLTEPTENSILYNDKDIFKLKGNELKEIRKKIGIVFQDPAASLNPRETIYSSLKRPLIINGVDKSHISDMVGEIIDKVNLGKELLTRYPHQLSGGQQQRASIARALMMRPELLVLDEPTSALDVSVQAQTLNVLLELQAEFNLTYLFITHNLSVVRYISDRICVMYIGKIMELATMDEIYNNPIHPYTAGLLASAPPTSPRDRGKSKLILSGELPSLINLPEGCRLQHRCPFCIDQCRCESPELVEVTPKHYVACHRALELKGTLK